MNCPLIELPAGCPLKTAKCPLNEPVPKYGTFTDPRDGRTYKTVKIGEQVWMAENLAFAYAGSKCYDSDLANEAKYGRLYDLETAKKAVPPGWHLPTNEEWDKLFRFVDGDNSTESPYDSETASKYLKAKSGYNEDGNGTDKYGFSALLGGGGNGYLDGSFRDLGYLGYWWSASEFNSYRAYFRYMYYNYDRAYWYIIDKFGLFSVRCLQDYARSAATSEASGENNEMEGK